MLVLSSAVFPQDFRNPKLSHYLKPSVEQNTMKKKFTSSADTIKLVAILIQFQEDNNPLTSGNGKFDLSNKYYNPSLQRDTVVDSPPYDSAYFADHLLFLKNYYYKSSKGKLVLNYDLYGHVITLPKKMEEYSPSVNSYDKLGDMFRDAWASADSIIDFSKYDENNTAFVMFHAGVGRDIDLASLIGFDPTPYDITSIYLGIKTLKDIFGQNYEGFPVNHNFKIKNSLIIPSTELRELQLTSGTFLLQLGINGMLTGAFGSYLGLPDLFNTATGRTAIGRFGLMDGQGIFSYNGIFPPEPSAWEKIFLGWVEPVTISYGEWNLNLKSSSTPEQKDSTIYKVLINSKEYFLVENRSRNPFNTGQKVYTHNRGFYDSALFTKDVPGFVNYDIFQVNGNLYDVSYLDWSLPGAIDDTANYRGGILIWHIDENVIDANIATNTINNVLSHRGVAVVEAKGSQDIGITYNTAFGTIISDGYFVDFWYNGNHYVPSSIYQNKFTPTSFPNSLSYSLANNNIFITDFDSLGYNMRLKIKVGSDVISPIAGFPKNLGRTVSNEFSQVIPVDINRNGKEALLVNNGQDLYGFSNNGTGLVNTNGMLYQGIGSFPALYGYHAYISDYRISGIQNGTSSSSIVSFKINSGTVADTSILNMPRRVSASPLLMDSSRIAIGLDNGFVLERLLTANQINYKDTTSKGQITRFSKESPALYRYTSSPYTNIISGNFGSANSVDSLTEYNSSELRINGSKLNVNYSSAFRNIIACDINKDGKQEIIYSEGNKLYAVNSAGILLDNFPFKTSSDITSGFSVCDINDEGMYDILFATASGDFYAVGSNGKVINGFPVKTGPNTYSTPALYNYNDTLAVSMISGDGYVYNFKTNHPYKSQNVLWKNYLKDKDFSNSNFRGVYVPPVYSDKMPKEKVYNWPNPVRDSKTYIRFYVNGSAATATVKILDLSGELVTKLLVVVNSYSDNEVVWDVSSVQSGVYYGVIEATIDGSTETRIIKIAVVK
ncbi:MAG: T9SS type A sorting domain-containing protein [Bacteroidetes bacterium]|nr:T9SS type A sorting domain-containing protein [Bacteroidota bacterium]